MIDSQDGRDHELRRRMEDAQASQNAAGNAAARRFLLGPPILFFVLSVGLYAVWPEPWWARLLIAAIVAPVLWLSGRVVLARRRDK